MENSPHRVLIIDTAWLGDVVFTTSLIGAVKEAWPAAELHLLVAPRGEAIVQHHPLVHRLWIYDKRGREKSLLALLRLGRELRKEKFDLVLNAHPSLRSRLLTRLTKAPLRVGYEGFAARYCFTHRVLNNLAIEPDHVERRMNLLRVLGIQPLPIPLSVGISSTDSARAEKYLFEHHAAGQPLLALICGSAWRTKQWSAENFAQLGRRWVAEHHGAVLVFGGEAERETINSICAKIGPGATPVIQEALPFVTALLARCETVVGNDTGLSFLAMAAGAQQVIVLYGSTQVNYRFPAPHRAITAGVPCCLPRTGHGAQQCHWSDQPWCMGQITVEQVWSRLSARASASATT